MDVGQHRGQLDVGILQDLVQTICGRTLLLNQPRTVAGQIPQLALLHIRDEAAFQQSQTHELRNPLGILYVGLAPRYLFEVMGIDYPVLKRGGQHIVDRFPVDAGRLHRHVRHAALAQPRR